MFLDDYIGEEYMIDFAKENGLTRKIVGHVFHKLVHDHYSREPRLLVATRPDVSEPRIRIRSWDFRLEYRVGDLIKLDPNLLRSDGCIRFMIRLQNHLRETIYQEVT